MTEGDAAVLVGPPLELGRGPLHVGGDRQPSGRVRRARGPPARRPPIRPTGTSRSSRRSRRREGCGRLPPRRWQRSRRRGRDRHRGQLRLRRAVRDPSLGRGPPRRRPLGVLRPDRSSRGDPTACWRRPRPAAAESARETGSPTHSDGDELYLAGSGGRDGARLDPGPAHAHRAEIADLADVEAAVETVEAYVRALSPEASFLR